MLTPKTNFLGTGPILYVCEIVIGLQETPIFCHNLSCMLLIYAILSLKVITLAPGWICLLLIVTKLLRLSSIAFVKANRLDPDDMPYSVDYHLGVLVPGCSCLLMSNLRNSWHKWMNYCAI